MSDLTIVATSAAPAALGPYSQGVVHGDVLYCSGTLAIDPATGDLVTTSAGSETTRCLENLAAVSQAAGTDLSRALRLTVYTTDLAAFDEINEAYARFFPGHVPARVTIQVAALPKGARIEIDAIVALP
jgi:2-iminobutanoate/2-iminopropanoate deaminase